MCELDPDFLVLGMQEVGDTLYGGDLRVSPQSGVLGSDAPVGEDGAGFDNCQGGAAVGEGGEVHEVEVGEVSVVCTVRAHRGDPNAVLECDIADLEGSEEGWWIRS